MVGTDKLFPLEYRKVVYFDQGKSLRRGVHFVDDVPDGDYARLAREHRLVDGYLALEVAYLAL